MNTTNQNDQTVDSFHNGKTIFACVYIEKILFSRTSRPISIKLDANHLWVKGILNYSN
jgi:hypothetical protein